MNQAAPRFQLKNLSHKHMAILEHMCANPAAKLREVAFVFDVSQAWLSSIIHTDMFQAKLADRTDECFSAIAIPLRQKLMGLAHNSVDKLNEKLETIEGPREIQDIAEMALEAVGYGPEKASSESPSTSIHIHIDADSLASARAKIGRTFENETKEIENSPIEVQTSLECDLVKVFEISTALSTKETEEENRSQTARNSL